jgi:hypothetical protein
MSEPTEYFAVCHDCCWELLAFVTADARTAWLAEHKTRTGHDCYTKLSRTDIAVSFD